MFNRVVRVGKLLLPTYEKNVVQKVQVQTSPFEVRDQIHSMQLFGLASSPPVGSDVIIVNVGADNSNGCVIASNHQQSRPQTLGSGDTMVYDANGQQVILSKSNGKLAITVKGGNEIDLSCDTAVNITCPTVTINGNLNVTGDVKAGTVSLKTHRHSNSGGNGTGGPPVT